MRWLTVNELQGKLAKGVRPVNIAVHKIGASEVEVQDDDKRLVSFVLSDDNVDRDKDTVSSKGWDLKNYLANPVVLWAHDYEQLPIARTVKIGVEGGQLKATAEFMPKELNPLSDTVYRMLKGGWLKGNSVGFKPKDFDYNSERKGVDFHAQELMEWSVCPIPSHPGALAEAKAAGVDLLPVQKWAVETLVAVQKAAPPWAPQTGKPQKCPECGTMTPADTCPKCGATMPTPSAGKAATIPGPMPPEGMDGPAGQAPTHEHGQGDPLRDVCANAGALCPKMQNQPCPLAEGCPVGKGATALVPKRGRMISAANEAKLRTAATQITSILDRLSPGDQASVMTSLGAAEGKAWPPGSDGAQTGTGFANAPPRPQPGTNPDAVQKPEDPTQTGADKITAAGAMVEFLAMLASQVATLLETLSPTHLTGGDKNPDDKTPTDPTSGTPSDSTPTSSGRPPFPPKKSLIELDGAFTIKTDAGQILASYPTKSEALAYLQGIEGAVLKTPADTVDEFLLELEEIDTSDAIDLGDLTAEDLAEVIKSAARSQAATQDRIRRGRVD